LKSFKVGIIPARSEYVLRSKLLHVRRIYSCGERGILLWAEVTLCMDVLSSKYDVMSVTFCLSIRWLFGR